MSAYKDLVGKTFGLLIVISGAGPNKYKRHTWLCKCECGMEKIIEGASLVAGNTKSCGCLTIKKALNKPLEKRSRKYAVDITGIYKIVNPNGAVYVGHSRTIYKRWIRHREARKKLKLYESLRKFGWRAHKFEIIHELPKDVSDSVLLQYEQLYIDCYKASVVEMLNVKDAGSSAKFSEESKKKMSEVHKGKIPWNKGLKGGNAMAQTYKENRK